MLYYGATYQAHATSLQCGYECIKYMIDNNLIQKSQENELIIKKYMIKMLSELKYDCIYQMRITGMGGCIDIKDPNTGNIICNFNETSEIMLKLRKLLYKYNVSTMMRGPLIHITPPLIANENDIKYGFDGITKALNELFD